MGLLDGKVVLITGGSTGIGRATAIAAAREGALTVAVSARTEATGTETVEAVRAIGGNAEFYRTDVRDGSAVADLVGAIAGQYGRLDCAFNNAGVEGEGVPLIEGTEEQWNSVIDTNLKGVWLCMKHEVVQMRAQGGGAIVNNSSILGVVANRSAIYTASKHGVNGLTKSAALTYAKENIRVNAVCPGYIDTPMVIRSYESNPAARANAIGRHPIGRLGRPEEIAEAVVWLLSDKASFATGLIMNVDGGYAVP